MKLVDGYHRTRQVIYIYFEDELLRVADVLLRAGVQASAREMAELSITHWMHEVEDLGVERAREELANRESQSDEKLRADLRTRYL